MKNENEIESAAISDRGLSESRPENEDSYLDLADCGIFAVADGVGGAEAGEVASQMAVEILSEAFTNIPDAADAEEVMRSAFSRANESIFQMSSEIPQLSRMATTIAALHLRGDVATIGHVGDSRLYRIDPDKKLVQETDDHSIVADEVRAGRLTLEQAASHPSRNIISRAIGAEPSVEVDMKTMMIEPGTSFLLCTDGVTRHVNDAEIRQILASHGEPGEICGQLKDLCYARGAEDNLTAVVVRFGTTDLVSEPIDESYYPFEEEEVTLAAARSSENGRLSEITVLHELDTIEELVLPLEDTKTIRAEETVRADDVNDSDNAVDFNEKVIVPGEFASKYPVETIESPVSISEEMPVSDRITERHREIFGDSMGYGYGGPTPRRTGNLLMMLGMLMVGLLAGGIGAYFLVGNEQPVPQAEVPSLNEMKSSNIPLTSFEESRRSVDRDPKRYIALNSNPQEAEDYFLLGRAYLLNGEYFMARNALSTAKSRIAEVDPRDARTIANEIELALAVIGSGAASEAFSKAVGITPDTAANSVPPANTIRPTR